MTEREESAQHRGSPEDAEKARQLGEDGARGERAGPDEHDDRDAHSKENDNPAREQPRKPRSKKPLVVLAVAVVALAIGGFVWWFVTRDQVSTDDAYTDGNAVAIAPKVSGYVTVLNVDDNLYVRKGDLLLVIDKRDYEARVQQARAQLGLATAQLNAAQVQLDIARVRYPAEYRQAQAQTASANATLREAQQAYARQHGVDARATSQQNIDAADAREASARASRNEADARLATAALAPQQIRQAAATVEERRQAVRQAEAQLAQAQLDLAWCEVRAPSDGWVTRRNVQLGSFLQAGTSLFSIVTPKVWITANYKESQLDRMRPGDKVRIDVDAYPDLELRGHVDSIQLGSGSRFSAFPAENATGNFVKIVQRVPVKIVIDSGLPGGRPLPLGLSVVPTVYVK